MLKAVIDELAKSFVAANVGASGRQRLRERTEDLMLDLLGALKTASLGEIAEATRHLERRRKARLSGRAVTNGASATRKSGRAVGSRARPPEAKTNGAERPSARDPFDITMPDDLLEPPASSTPLFRAPPRATQKESANLAAASSSESVPAVSARDAGVSLREGEQLLRTGGSGAIIRRVRGS